MEYNMNTDYLQIIAGTSNRYNPVYEAAEKDVDKNTDKGLKYLQNFLNSIENISGKKGVQDQRISKSHGNIREFTGYDNIKFAVDFLSKNLGNIQEVKDCSDMLKYLQKFQPQYTEAYDKKNKLGILEYESGVYMLTTTLSMLIANNIDVVANGTEIKIQKTKAETFGVIPKTMHNFVLQLKDTNHKLYLDELNKSLDKTPEMKATTEGVYVEDVAGVITAISAGASLGYQIIKNLFGAVKGGFNIFAKIKKSVFGIVPIVRSVAYLRYKKKADTVVSLDQQCEFIRNNIDQLQNRTNMDPKKKEEIIKKQKATIEAYQKKANKLRAELMETEKDASTAQAKEDKQIGDVDDDMILESGRTIIDMFTESDDPDSCTFKFANMKEAEECYDSMLSLTESEGRVSYGSVKNLTHQYPTLDDYKVGWDKNTMKAVRIADSGDEQHPYMIVLPKAAKLQECDAPTGVADESFGQSVNVHNPLTNSKGKSIFSKDPFDSPSGISSDLTDDMSKDKSVKATKLAGNANDVDAIKGFGSLGKIFNLHSAPVRVKKEDTTEVDERFGPHFHEVEKRLQGDPKHYNFDDRIANSPLGQKAAQRNDDDDPDKWNDPEPYDPKYDRSVAKRDDPDEWNDPEPFDPDKRVTPKGESKKILNTIKD